MLKHSHKIMYTIGVVILLCSICFLCYFIAHSYAFTIDKLLYIFQSASISKDFIKTRFTELQFQQAIFYSKILLCLMVLLFFICMYYKSKIQDIIWTLLKVLKAYTSAYFTTFNALTKSTKGVLFFLLLGIAIRSIYYATTWYIQHDEAWNYNLYLNRNPIYTLLLYNNYPLHNIITWIFVHILPMCTFTLRLPVIIAGLCTTYLVFVVVYKWYQSETIALLTALFFACLPVNIFYMLYARGVMFELFFAIASFYILIKTLQDKLTINRMYILILMNTMGIWSMVSHLYFMVIAYAVVSLLWLTHGRKKDIFKLGYVFIFSILISITAFIGFFISGTYKSAVQSNVSERNLTDTLYNIPFHNYSSFITGFQGLFYILLLLNVYTLIYFFNKNRIIALLSFFNIFWICTPLLIYICNKTYLPERAYAFIVLAPVFSFSNLVYIGYKPQYVKWIVSFSCLVCIAISYKAHTHNFITWSKALDKHIFEFSEKVNQEKITCIYSQCNNFVYFIPLLHYYNPSLNIYTNNTSSRFYLPVENNTCNCVALHKNDTNIDKLKMDILYQYGNVIIYRKKLTE